MAFEMKDRLQALKHGVGDIVDETTIDVETEDDFDEVFGSVSF
jgi:hypothetical protein